MIKKRKNFGKMLCFRHRTLDFPSDKDRFADEIFDIMNAFKEMDAACRMLMTGEKPAGSQAETVAVENMLYSAFGMSSEDILEIILSCEQVPADK